MCLAIPGMVKEISGDALDLKGKIDFSGALKDVNLAYVPEVKVGEYVIVHAGFAISIVDEEEAKETLRYLDEIEQQNSEAGN